MGQKVNPHGARVGVIFDWSTRWYANKKDFANNLVEDFKIRKMLKEKYYQTGISHIDIERSANRITVNIFTAKPGMIIGRGGAGIEALKRDIDTFLGKPANINIMEIKTPETERAAGGREHRPAAGEAHLLPPRDEAEHAARHESRRQGHQDAWSPAASAARTSPAPSTTTKDPSRCRRCAPTSTTASAKRKPPTAAWASRCGSTKASACPRPNARKAPRPQPEGGK